MGHPESQPQLSVVRAERGPITGTDTQRGLYQCLVVSPSDERCDRLLRAAVSGGWSVTARDDPDEAARTAARYRFELGIVDLQRRAGLSRKGYCALAEILVRQTGFLLVLCGNESDMAEEIWAHQIGTWLYLPGVDGDSDLARVCSEARVAAEKLAGHGSSSPTRGPTVYRVAPHH